MLKGPTAAFMQWAGQPLSSDGIAAIYDGVIDGLVADEPHRGDPHAARSTCSLGDPASERRAVAEQTLRFATDALG